MSRCIDRQLRRNSASDLAVESPQPGRRAGRAGDTRFLVITHHRLTMARMDRLFGVTMSERGLSQLVSVDLQDAHELKAAQ